MSRYGARNGLCQTERSLEYICLHYFNWPWCVEYGDCAAATATINRIPVLLLPGDVFACRQPDPVLQQLEVHLITRFQ